MYADTGLLHPYFQNFSQQLQQQLNHFQQSHSPMISSISEYDFGEGDLFKAPEPIVEEPVVSFDPMLDVLGSTAGVMSFVDDVVPDRGLNVGDLDSLQNEQFLNEFLCEPKKDVSGNISELPTTEIVDINLPAKTTSEIQNEEKKLVTESAFEKCVSSGCLSSMEWVNGNSTNPSFLDFSESEFGAAYGIRRAFSEGDIKTLAVGNINLIRSPLPQPPGFGSCISEDRLQKLCRYRNKKSRRNFGRKIKYACRKALADSQPRIRGRFAKTDEADLQK